MCGIFTITSTGQCKHDEKQIKTCFMKGQKRGPEYSYFSKVNDNTFLGFHRLAINGYHEFEKSNQPFCIDGVYLICNGEIYNHKKINEITNVIPKSKSDCESIIHLYLKYGIKQTLQILDGVFAFILLDTRNECDKLFAARDPYGVRPLFINYNNNNIMLASETKQLIDLKLPQTNINQFAPGEYMEYDISLSLKPEFRVFSKPVTFSTLDIDNSTSYNKIYNILYDAVKKRVDNTERDIACLLSGGLDSSVVTALVKKVLPDNVNLHTWSIGLQGSDDLKYAQKVADHIGSIHHSIVVSEREFLEAIPEVIYTIESYDTTTVRASVCNWLICKKIRDQSDAKVVFNGDGADELMGGYLYFHESPDPISFDKECRKLLSNIHYFDVLRSDRCISSHGLEARTPFLDRKFVQTYLSIDCTVRDHKYNNKCEKYLIREAIERIDPGLIPHEVLFRTKEAFSDGVSRNTRSWYKIIQEYINKIDNITEKEFYKTIYDISYPGETPIPYEWMPNFVKNASDASARTLDIYSKLHAK